MVNHLLLKIVHQSWFIQFAYFVRPQSKTPHNQFTFIEVYEKQQTFTFEKLEPVDFGHTNQLTVSALTR